MRELSLFTGAGGGIWATKYLLGWTTVCYVEKDEYCQDVIDQRITDGFFDEAPTWFDVKTFDGKEWRGKVDVITAGFPCQPFSLAGQRKGESDERNLWPETIRIIREVQPEWVLLENVPGLLVSYFGEILGSLAESGYDARWQVLSARGEGAPHLRKRVWIVAHARCQHGKEGSWEAPKESSAFYNIEQSDWWTSEPDMGRVAHGVANRVNRLKALGNGQVPAVVARAWEELSCIK